MSIRCVVIIIGVLISQVNSQSCTDLSEIDCKANSTCHWTRPRNIKYSTFYCTEDFLAFNDDCDTVFCGSGRECVDPTLSHADTGDSGCWWKGGFGSGGTRASQCTVCGAANEGVHQSCVVNADSIECVCDPLHTGRSVNSAAICDLNECSSQCQSTSLILLTDRTCSGAINTPSLIPLGTFATPDDCRLACTSSRSDCLYFEYNTATLDCWFIPVVRTALGTPIFNASCPSKNLHGASTGVNIYVAVVMDCSDTNNRVAMDYSCNCTYPLAGSAVAFTPECVFDECKMLDPCSSVGLGLCEDPVPSVSSLGDYLCSCPTPTSPGCLYDECGANPCGPLQTCTDPSQLKLFDFQCQCDGLTNTIISIASPAVCYLNECDTSPCGPTQRCTDEVPNSLTSSLNDYICSCIAPSTGTAVVGGVAACVYDECADESGIALCGQNQFCTDPVQTADSLYDFVCTCRNGGGSATGEPATVCDDCSALIIPPPCGTNTDQICIDPQLGEDSQFDFICECPLPSYGYAVGTTAACYYDECSGDPCLMSQLCEDRDWRYPQARNSYTCTCVSPATGATTTGTAATCTYNECGGTPCGAGSGQICNDPNTSAESLRDFVCTCGSGVSQIGFPARCSNPMGIDGPFDECAVPGSNGAGPCNVAQSQSCFDTFTTTGSLGNYICFCNAPASGTPQTNGQATCTHNECAYTACLGIVAGVCNPYHHQGVTQCGPWQSCNDGNTGPLSTKDYTCGCGMVPWVFGAGGQQQSYGTSRTGRPAECYINECNPCGHITTQPACTAAAASTWRCQWNVGSQTCNSLQTPCGDTALGVQECIEGSILSTDLYDFNCRCTGMYQGMTQGGPANCIIDECRGGASRPGHLHYDPYNAGTIELGPCGIGQICDDPDTTVDNDFVCRCRAPASSVIPPFVGQQQPAVCSYNVDECWTFLGCLRAQYPLDMVANPSNNLKSRCEILSESLLSPCGVGQSCYDPILGNMNTDLQNYECSCNYGTITVPPLGIGEPATCDVNECEISNPCGTDDDSNLNGAQTCVDDFPFPDSLFDFVCTCTNIPTRYSTGTFATCNLVNECMNDNPCNTTDYTQHCTDPDFTILRDYQCSCTTGVGTTAVGGPATCVLDQCDSVPSGCQWSTAITGGLVVTDSADVALHLISESVEASVADCQATCSGISNCKIIQYDSTSQACYSLSSSGIGVVYSSEVGSTVVDSYVCFEVSCTDPDPTTKTLTDVVFECVSPSVGSVAGVFSVNAIVCNFDECLYQPCGEDQHCRDPVPLTTSVNDFQCSCLLTSTGVLAAFPATVFATGSPSVCPINECAQSPLCGSGQTCTDPDENVQDDYICSCSLPLVGIDVIGQPASCVLDECVEEPCITMSDYYHCFDPIQTQEAIGNYDCQCVSPAQLISGECVFDECPTSCLPKTDFTCTDTDLTKVGGVQCTPIPPYDECVVSGENPCGEGQTCQDSNTHPTSLLDFTCTCDNNKVTTATGRPVTRCLFDECDGYDCGESATCNDPTKTIHNGQLLDFECTCVPPSEGMLVIGSATVCYYNECSIHQPCHDGVSSQWCLDPTPTPGQRNDYECYCILPYVGSGIGAAADCVLDECLIEPSMCPMNHDCFDPDTGTSLSSRKNVICTLRSTPVPTTAVPLTPFPPDAVSGCGNNSCSSCPSQPDCVSLNTLCVWLPAVNVCQEEQPPPSSCFDSSLQTEIACISTPLSCRWDGSACVPNTDMVAHEECDLDTFCSGINEFHACANYQQTCTWVDTSLRCVRNSCCGARTRQIDCEAVGGCTWVTDPVAVGELQCRKSVTASCDLLTEPDDCYSSSLNCYWDTTSSTCLLESGIGCNTTCIGCRSYSSCSSQGCSWDQDTILCSASPTLQPQQPSNCNTTQYEVCVLENVCRWHGGRCIHFTTFFDECLNNSNPCGVVPAAQGGQVCSDTTLTIDSVQDFVCICPNNPSIRRQAAPVTDCSVIATGEPAAVPGVEKPVFILELQSGQFPLATSELLPSLQNISNSVVTIEWFCKADDCQATTQCSETKCECPLLQRDSCLIGSGSGGGAATRNYVGFTAASDADPQVLMSEFRSRLGEVPFTAVAIMWQIPPPAPVQAIVDQSDDSIPPWVIPVCVAGILILLLSFLVWAYYRYGGSKAEQNKYQPRNSGNNESELEGSQNTSNPLDSEFSPRREEGMQLYR